MRKVLSLAVTLCCILHAMAADNHLEKGFRNPPASAKAQTWWHWINGNVTREGITADLEAMKENGIQEAQIFNVDQGYPEGEAPFLSERWMELFRFALEEAERLGLEIGLNNCAGWSSSGGSWITPEYGMQTVTYSITQCTGGKPAHLSLPQPNTRLNYYRDITVIAFPTPTGEKRIDRLDVKTLANNAFASQLTPDTKEIDKASCIQPSTIINVTEHMNADGTLTWDAPAGKWTIIRFGHTPTGSQNRPANLYGLGLECDKMSREAVDVFWDGGIKPILQTAGSHVGKTLTNCLIDSYEVGCGNWTSGFEKEFKRLNGYDCIRFLPTLAGYYVDNGEITERFLWDFRHTIGQLMEDNYYRYFAERCRSVGMKFSVEPYGGPFNWLQTGTLSEVPMGEFWIGGAPFLSSAKLAASAAHLSGTPYVGAEAFTAGGENSRWLNHPAKLKQLGDWAWSEGINRFIFHTYTHQPWNIGPGMTFHMYGLEMNRLNTWWKPGSAYLSYIARSQFLLQQGNLAADILVFVGESSPNEGIYRSDLKQSGYDYDEISAAYLDSLTVKDGVMRTPAGGRYQLLILPDNTWATPKLLRTLKRLANDGATIIGKKPNKSPGLTNYPQCDKEVERLATTLWDSEKLIRDIPVEQALKKAQLAPDFRCSNTSPQLLFLHRTAEGAEIYFVANPQRQYRSDTCRFRTTGLRPERWNAETGLIEPLVEWKEEQGCTVIPLRFHPEESYFIVFRKSSQDIDPIVSYNEQTEQDVVPLRKLKIIHAEYGYFLPENIINVTDVLSKQIKDKRLSISANNDIAGDPAPGAVKELRIKYRVDGNVKRITIPEQQSLTIPLESETGKFKLLQALYGYFQADFDDNLPAPPIDVTDKIQKLIADRKLTFRIGETLGKPDNHSAHPEQLRLQYEANGELFDEMYPNGAIVDLAQHEPDSYLTVEKDKPIWVTPFAGKVHCETASGQILEAKVDRIPPAIDLSNNWDVEFQQNSTDNPNTYRFDTLCSWPERPEEAVKYYSGTATYRKRFNLPKDYLGKNHSLYIELGRVCVMAEVIVNGRNMGILWKEPYQTDITQALRTGENVIEIRVTNLWANRLIGDARYPDDVEWGDWLPKKWPDWLLKGTKRPSNRSTFAGWRHWGQNDPLQPSGLIGPVVLRLYVCANLLEQ